ncbi:MAG: hypothetical protein ACTSRW_10270 [Candidatus Helarchaeota archaeon]
MKKGDVETKMTILHHKMNVHHLIKGSILCRDDGVHVSSNIPTDLDEGRKLAAYITHAFRLINKINKTNEATLKFNNGMQFFVKHIPDRKLILTALTDRADSPRLSKLMNHFSNEFQKAL